jgi:hypothetical protein
MKSWFCPKIRSYYDGEYIDNITKKNSKWVKDTLIKFDELIIIALYTDFDKLQVQLKKCFRYEKGLPIYAYQLSKTPSNMSSSISKSNSSNSNSKSNNSNSNSRSNSNSINNMNNDLATANLQLESLQTLEQRLAEFFHWRIGLQIALHKFGKKIGHSTL